MTEYVLATILILVGVLVYFSYQTWEQTKSVDMKVYFDSNLIKETYEQMFGVDADQKARDQIVAQRAIDEFMQTLAKSKSERDRLRETLQLMDESQIRREKDVE